MAIIKLEKQAELIENATIGNRIGQAAFSAAIAISNEAPETPNHAARKQLANTVIMNWAFTRESFLRSVLTQLSSGDPSDEELCDAVAAIWDAIALAMYPGLEQRSE